MFIAEQRRFLFPGRSPTFQCSTSRSRQQRRRRAAWQSSHEVWPLQKFNCDFRQQHRSVWVFALWQCIYKVLFCPNTCIYIYIYLCTYICICQFVCLLRLKINTILLTCHYIVYTSTFTSLHIVSTQNQKFWRNFLKICKWVKWRIIFYSEIFFFHWVFFHSKKTKRKILLWNGCDLFNYILYYF